MVIFLCLKCIEKKKKKKQELCNIKIFGHYEKRDSQVILRLYIMFVHANCLFRFTWLLTYFIQPGEMYIVPCDW
jgi:hypothetical protein